MRLLHRSGKIDAGAANFDRLELICRCHANGATREALPAITSFGTFLNAGGFANDLKVLV